MKQESLRLYKYIWSLKRQTIHVATGTFGGKQAPEKKNALVVSRFSFFFFIEVTSNPHVEVSVPLGDTKEAIPF